MSGVAAAVAAHHAACNLAATSGAAVVVITLVEHVDGRAVGLLAVAAVDAKGAPLPPDLVASMLERARPRGDT